MLDLAETLPERPVGMYDVARGQCRSLSEDPRRRRSNDVLPSARRVPRAICPLETIFEDEVGDDIPATHVLFLPMDPNLGPAPFSVLGQSGPPDEVGGEGEVESGVASSSQPAARGKPKFRIGADDSRCRE